MSNTTTPVEITIELEKHQKVIGMLVGMKYMYEHVWHDKNIKYAICEKCNELVEIFTPCKASPHYPCWYALNEIQTELMEWIGITSSDKDKT